MKHQIPLFAFAFVLHLAATAAVPLHWTVETSRATPAQFEAYQGETLDLEAALQSYGKPLEASGIAALYWQTNGMGSAYWEASAAVNSNRISAVWTPEMDVGAKVYNCFIGVPGTVYHAAFQLRLRPSPGALPNVLPLPVPVIDFAKVRVLNPPWESGGGGGINTNAVIDIIHATVDGAARPLPPYLHAIDFDDSYPDAAAWYYAEPQGFGHCSAKRVGGFVERNYDWLFDRSAEFVVRMSAGPDRFASVGVASCGTNLSEEVVTSGKPSRFFKCLPGMTLDGINENGVVAEINVCTTNGMEHWNAEGTVHVLGAVRWALDHATNAQHAAEYLAANVKRPARMNFHYLIADATSTYIVENGAATPTNGVPVMTNHGLFPSVYGGGMERDSVLASGSITNAWWTNAYRTGADWVSDFESEAQMLAAQAAWNAPGKTKEDFRGAGGWWQSVHTSIYDITNRVLRISVQETDDWYTFALAKNGTDEAKVREIAGEVVAPVAATVSSLQSSVSDLQSSKADKSTTYTKTEVDAALAAKRGMTNRDWIDETDAGIVFTVTNAKQGQIPLQDASGDYNYETGDPEYGDAWFSSSHYRGYRIVRSGNNFRWHVPGVTSYAEFSGLGPHDLTLTAPYIGNFTCHIEVVRKTDTLALSSEVPAPYTPPPYLRVYDEVRQCWWRGRMVNGVINWEVE